MTITDALRGEHGVLYRMLDRAAAGTDASVATLRGTAAALDAAVRSHAEIEEELLFRPLDAHLEGVGPLAVMRAEHDEIEATLGHLGEVETAGEAVRLLAHLAAVAREHFAKEEEILFPWAERQLPAATLVELGEAWARARGVALG